ncbi:hypothetical protein FNU76_21105 [Chitinimonas arctica]|uniref:Uncharacterized protein n=1 Tax=Chitinimonas arctica TaxID=2594795 RepID=A0A516SKG7_9NEIS|nr:hypothetical protein [Chitinimonas arctica]QDQ28651.1 hypothetical protein FNU76_21105 [Chitinimonas arctica]
MNHGNLVVVYHGCDATVRDDLVSGQLGALTESNNRYDWLGPGAYFFENDPVRAQLFAQASKDNPEKLYTAKPIAAPAVVGAVLRISHWLDMTTQPAIQEFTAYLEAMKQVGLPLPKNHKASDSDVDILLRELDRAVFKFIHEARVEDKQPAYQAVRGAFSQGDRVAENSGFSTRTHIQIALREPSCVLGWFLPPEAKLMADAEYEAVAWELAQLNRTRKPKIRARKAS